MNIPTELYYKDSHECCRVDGDFAYIGITDFAQEQLGDITYIELPKIGAKFAKNDSFGTVEAVKAASDVYLPIGGEIVEINTTLEDAPETVNSDCYGEGWLVKIKMSNKAELDSLLRAEAYADCCHH
jgi:glycine cleavage system H protein